MVGEFEGLEGCFGILFGSRMIKLDAIILGFGLVATKIFIKVNFELFRVGIAGFEGLLMIFDEVFNGLLDD